MCKDCIYNCESWCDYYNIPVDPYSGNDCIMYEETQ